jgi:hypothetical protein
MGLKLIPVALAAATLTATTANAAPGPDSQGACFSTRNWDGWSASRDGDALYLRVGRHDIYRVDLTKGSHVRKDADRFLINRVRGSDWVCSPLDLQLTLSDHQGFREPLIVRALRKLTPEEVAAIPQKDLPR